MKSNVLALFVCICLLLSLLPAPVRAAEPAADGARAEADGNEGTYRAYRQQNAAVPPAAQEITLAASGYTAATAQAQAQRADAFAGQTDVLLWNGVGGAVEWTLTVPTDALYAIELTYYALNAESRNVELGLQIDGETPFDMAAQIVLPRLFHSDGAIHVDERGNDVRPEQLPYDSWLTRPLRDDTGLFNEPYQFRLTAGEHTLRLTGVRAAVALTSLRLYTPAALPDYASYAAGAQAAAAETAIYEAEAPAYVSDSILYPVYDRSGPDTSPADPVKLRLNTIGQSNWSTHGQSITWTVRAPADGHYRIGLRYRQNLQRNLTSYRRLYINGEVPFREADAIAFPFSDKWQTIELGGGWLFHLRKGDNTITLEAVPGPMGEVIAELENTIYRMNTLYRKIIMITSVNPDANRDYHLEKQIPGLEDTFRAIRASCEGAMERLQALSGQNTAASTSALNSIVVQMGSFLAKLDTVAVRVGQLKNNISSLSSLLLSLKNQPLELDYLAVGGEDALFREGKGFFRGLAFGVQSFLGSFFEDYTAIGKQYQGSDPVNVWINLGRDQTQVIKNMADSLFTPKTGIPVNVSLVQQSLVQATLSGRGPDVVIFVGQGEPVNLAARHALVELSGFAGFDEVTGRFHEQAMVPYRYDGGCYALPVTEDFPMMFYRTDIFEELGLQPPATWDAFYAVLSVLQRHNMTAGIPNMPPESQMSTNTGMYAMLLRQMGAAYMNADGSATNFASAEGVAAFQMWTGFYGRYGLPYQYDFFNRFRTGEMPLGIDSYTLFNKLYIGAPEVKGLWKMVPVPGLLDEAGTLQNQTCASGTAMLMLKRTVNREAAWRFMDWFTSDDAQAGYGLQIESLLGASGRYNTANRKAMEKLPWSAGDQQLIQAQWDNIIERPQVPGGYYIDRNLTNAFRAVVFNNRNAREVLLDYNKEINLEITRKRQEFGLEAR